MASSLKARLFAQASQDAGLQALLLNGSTFQFGDQQLPQFWNITTKDAILVRIVSNPKDYVNSGPMVTSFARVQFTIFAHGNDSENASAVAAALFSFIQGFNAGQASSTGTPGPNYVLNDMDAQFLQTDPQTYQRIIDIRIFSNDQF